MCSSDLHAGPRLADGRHQEIGLAGDGAEVRRAGMADGDRGVPKGDWEANSMAMGLPTMLLRPMTTAILPTGERPYYSISLIMP